MSIAKSRESGDCYKGLMLASLPLWGLHAHGPTLSRSTVVPPPTSRRRLGSETHSLVLAVHVDKPFASLLLLQDEYNSTDKVARDHTREPPT